MSRNVDNITLATSDGYSKPYSSNLHLENNRDNMVKTHTYSKSEIFIYL